MVDVIIPTARGMGWLSMTLATLLVQTKVSQIRQVFILDDSGEVECSGRLIQSYVEAFAKAGIQVRIKPGAGGRFFEYKPNYYWLLRYELTEGISHVLFLDDDLALKSTFLEELLRHKNVDMVSGYMLVLDDAGVTEEDVKIDCGQDWLLTGMALYSTRLLDWSREYNPPEKSEARFKDWGFLMSAFDEYGFTCLVEPAAKAWHLGVSSYFKNWERDMVEWRKSKGV